MHTISHDIVFDPSTDTSASTSFRTIFDPAPTVSQLFVIVIRCHGRIAEYGDRVEFTFGPFSEDFATRFVKDLNSPCGCGGMKAWRWCGTDGRWMPSSGKARPLRPDDNPIPVSKDEQEFRGYDQLTEDNVGWDEDLGRGLDGRFRPKYNEFIGLIPREVYDNAEVFYRTPRSE